MSNYIVTRLGLGLGSRLFSWGVFQGYSGRQQWNLAIPPANLVRDTSVLRPLLFNSPKSPDLDTIGLWLSYMPDCELSHWSTIVSYVKIIQIVQRFNNQCGWARNVFQPYQPINVGFPDQRSSSYL